MKDRFREEIGTKERDKWAEFNWKLIKRRVKKLRQRIFRATQKKEWNRVRSLMKLMLRSRDNLLLAIKRVSQINKGKNTAGVDGRKVNTNSQRLSLFLEIQQDASWKAKPTRRVYIPKSNGKKRPLGIPTIKDRVLQSIVKNALEPSWEAQFEATSYGFRPGRSIHDAITYSHNRLRKGMDNWVLDADIKGAFDNISHNHILKTLGNVPGIKLIEQWLKAGYVENEVFNTTKSGTPQGGIISPLLANIALHGLSDLLDQFKKVKVYQSSPNAKRQRTNKQKLPKFGYCRYADDFIVTAENEEDLTEVIPIIEKWLQERGLKLNKEKTQVVNTKDGFSFLGFTIRKFNQSCFCFPQKDKVLKFLQDIRNWLKKHKDIPAIDVINHLNPILTGWANNYRMGASKRVFSYINHQIFRALWLWAKRRHPNKGKKWIARKYFNINWRFKAKHQNRRGDNQTLTLVNIAEITIVRHVMVKGENSPDNPELKKYWEERQTNFGKKSFALGSRDYKVACNQNWKCPVCGEGLFNGEDLHQHHIKQVKDGGYDYEDNLIFIHKACHQDLHSAKGA
ncbi:MAG: group II intron reverse transcriptase/maturase [Cyanobacteria bacterium J06635_10]